MIKILASSRFLPRRANYVLNDITFTPLITPILQLSFIFYQIWTVGQSKSRCIIILGCRSCPEAIDQTEQNSRTGIRILDCVAASQRRSVAASQRHSVTARGTGTTAWAGHGGQRQARARARTTHRLDCCEECCIVLVQGSKLRVKGAGRHMAQLGMLFTKACGSVGEPHSPAARCPQ